ncbi:MAG: amino acid ABC transporter ATP-binding protein [Oscillospiraceae bacterium]|nr:amino acid ABC transporter ATP-binding protein [Oscillospiraceae bacterium]
MIPKIQIKKLSKSYNGLKVLDGIDLDVKPEEKVCVVGPSGSGKSTLLRCINGLEKTYTGEILINNCVSQKNKDKRIGMIFQHYNLFSNLNVMENITLAPICSKLISKKDAESYALKFLAKVGLEDKLYSYPSQLSGGQAQRVAIARSLANKPEVLLFDEPTSALDPERKDEILEIINNLSDTGMTMVIVTHEMEFVKNIADKVVFMDNARIIEENSPDKFFTRPETKRAQMFVKISNLQQSI